MKEPAGVANQLPDQWLKMATAMPTGARGTTDVDAAASATPHTCGCDHWLQAAATTPQEAREESSDAECPADTA